MEPVFKANSNDFSTAGEEWQSGIRGYSLMNTSAESRVKANSISTNRYTNSSFYLPKYFRKLGERQDYEVIPKDPSKFYVPELANLQIREDGNYLNLRPSSRIRRPIDKVL